MQQQIGLKRFGYGSVIHRDISPPEDYRLKRGLLFGAMIVGAMLAFELFNFSTTDFALANLLGDLRFVGARWATILAIAFCGIDFAGIARLFMPSKERGEQAETWYLLAAWFLAATMNAMLTWWGVALALLEHGGLGNEILSRGTLLSVAPVFVAVLVWVIRILLIGMLSMAGDRLFRPAAGAHATAARTAGRQALANTAAPDRTIRGSGGEELNQVRTVAERHGYANRAAPSSQTPVRPAPKPAGQSNSGGQTPTVRKPVTVGSGAGLGARGLDAD